LDPSSLPNGRVNDPYAFDFSTLIRWGNLKEGATPPQVTWSSAHGLPEGLSLDAQGRLTGTPTQSGYWAFELTATVASQGVSSAKLYSVTVTTAIRVFLDYATLPKGKVNQAYEYDFSPLVSWQGLLSGEEGPAVTWRATGDLPEGLELGADGRLTGTPTQSVSLNYEIEAATEGDRQKDKKSYLITIEDDVISASSIQTGNAFSCALTTERGIKCWGQNAYYQLGTVTPEANSYTPMAVNGLQGGVREITIGSEHGCAITDDDTLYCWGSNAGGQVGIGSTSTRVLPTAVMSNVKTAAANTKSTCAITNNNDIFCWGDGGNGVLGNGTIADKLTPTQVTGTGKFKAISGRGSYYLAVHIDGSIWGWGNNSYKVLGAGSASYIPVKIFEGYDQKAIYTGHQNACLIDSNNGLKCWGSNNNGQFGFGIAGGSYTEPTSIPGMETGVTSVGIGMSSRMCVVKTSVLYCAGYNANGSLGNGSYDDSYTFQQPVGLTANAVSVSTGNGHTCGTFSDKGVKCWGNNSAYQSGQSTGTKHLTPKDVSF